MYTDSDFSEVANGYNEQGGNSDQDNTMNMSAQKKCIAMTYQCNQIAFTNLT